MYLAATVYLDLHVQLHVLIYMLSGSKSHLISIGLHVHLHHW